MADALDDIRAAVHAQTRLAALVGSAHGTGKLEAERLGDYPRVVWISPGGTVGTTEYIGGRPNVAVTARNRQIRTDNMTVAFQIWGEDRENARDIMHALVAACWAELVGSVDFGAYEWVTQGEERGEFAISGQLLVLSATIQLPIMESVAGDTLTDITDQSHRGDFEPNDGGTTITGICQT